MTRKLTLQPWISASTAILFLRLILGVIFLAHGSQKLLGWFGGYGVAGTLGFFAKMGIPTPLGYAAIFAEFFGGLMLLLGLFSRLGAFAIGVNMAVAILKVHLAKGFFNPTGFEFPLMLLVSAVTVFLYGPGLYSVDASLFGRIEEPRTEEKIIRKAA
jgi:putative oxidoreductase